MVKKLLLLIIIVLHCLPAVQAQVASRVSIDGQVKDADTEKAVPMATVVIKEMGRWAVTDHDGNFSITGIPAGSYTMEISLLGYETAEFAVNLMNDITDGQWLVRESSLKLDEVVMIATSGKSGTSSRIEQQALEHIQPSSIKDVLQLLPGRLTENPSLNAINRLTIREIRTSDVTNAMGVALIVDGAGISNDANMQVLKAGDGATDNATAGTGIDARQMSTDNIESIEVVRGIASAEYGDMTSGAIIVKTKAGVAPWAVRFKTDPSLKQIALGKGFGLGSNAGALNFGLDYALAQKDPRTPAEAYDRINASVAYSNNFNKLSFNAKLTANYSNSSTKSDPDNLADNIATERNTGVDMNINGRWTIAKPWITNLEYVIAGSIAEQYSRDKRFRTPGRTPMSTALSSGENVGFFTVPQYYSDIRVEGAPIKMQTKLVANLYGKYGNVLNKVLMGVEFTTQGNNGKGKSFDAYCPPDPNSNNALRDRSYKDVPFLSRLTFFAEDKLTLPIGPTSLEMVAGVRINSILPSDKFSMSELTAIEPRFDMRYLILKQHAWFKELAIRGGWGVFYKMPSMIHLFPEPAYLDRVSYSYNDITDNGYALNVFTTKRIDKTSNPDLKLQRSEKLELGLDFSVGKVFGDVVFFREKLTNGYGFSTFHEPFYYTRYGYRLVNDSPTIVPVPGGQQPVYYIYDNNGVITRDVFVNGQPLPKIQDTTFVSYSTPQNGVRQTKWGIEYVVNLGTIRALNTSINVNGAYINIRRENTALTSLFPSATTLGRFYPFVAIYAGNAGVSNGSIDEKLNTNLNFITHIPKIRMVVTLGVEMVFIDRSRNISEYDGEILAYFLDENGIKHTGKEVYLNTQYTKSVDPVYVMDKYGKRWTYEEIRELYPNFDFSERLTQDSNLNTTYLRQGFPFYGLLNLRVTKEISNIATVSFYANNFVNILGRVRNDVTGYLQDRNSAQLYFGAEVKLTF
ncbi:MAG: TonB-dependent receptor [Bacteroidales bacterium]|nr:TonB-dependent receptor [Bacteroidales bacterium]MCL2133260.1 TonB-dependent receptor [Bacteroidales bacterium]